MIQHSQDVSIRTQAGRRGRAALVRYISAATLARSADAGGAVGILLLAVDPGTGIRNGPLVGGLLAAAITLPHLLGSLLGKWLDRARDGRIVLAAGCVAYGAFLGVAAVLLGRAPLPLARSAVFAAGMCGPLLTGCLSSRLASMVDGDGGSQRRAEGWDAVTYGVAGTAGPAAVAALAAVTTPLTAMLTLAAGAVAAAVLILTLPRTEAGAGSEREALSVWAALRVMGACGPLRRVTVATVLTALSGGTLAVVAVVFGEALAGRSGAGAALVAAAGLGNLAGSLAVTAFPLRGEPERLTARWAAAIAVALGLCAAAPSYPLALAAFTLVGAVNAPFFTPTLAARSEYSPEGGRAQVFVSSAGLKVAAASAGTALAGAAAGVGARHLLVAAAVVALAAAALTVLDRRVTIGSLSSSSRTRHQPTAG